MAQRSGRGDARGLHRNVKLRLGVGFVTRMLGFMLLPLMAIRLAGLYGVGTAGVLLGVVTCGTIGCTLYSGHLADTRGRRPVLLLAEFGTMLGYAAMAAANSPWWHSGAATYGGFLVISCMSGLAFPANDAMMIDVATPESRLTIYTINYWSLNLAFSCGAIIGSFLYVRHFDLLLASAAVLSAGVFTVTFTALTETAPFLGVRSDRVTGVRALLAGYRAVLRDGVFARVLAAATLVRGVEAQISYYIAVRLAHDVHRTALVHWGHRTFSVDGVEMLGLLRTINTVLVVCLALFVKRLLRGVSDQVRLMLGIGLYTGGFMVLAVSDTGWLLIGAAVTYTIGELMSAPVRQVLVADFADPASRTRYMAVFSMQTRVGVLIASVCMSLSAAISPTGMALLYLGMGGTALMIYHGLFRRRPARLAEFAGRGADAGHLAEAPGRGVDAGHLAEAPGRAEHTTDRKG